MQKRTNTRRTRRLFLDRDIERLKQQLTGFQTFLSRRKAGLALEEFDLATERVISRVFGESSEQLEAYQYAKLGEASSLVNLPEEAQESGAQDKDRESLQQRKRVLESCVTELETLRPRERLRTAASGPGCWRGRKWRITCRTTCGACTRMPR